MKTGKPKEKPGGKVQPKKSNPNALQIPAMPGEEKEQVARSLIMPSVTGGIAMRDFIKRTHGEVDLMALINATKEQIENVQNGELGRAEAMLISQAHTLDIIFNELARRAAMNMGEYLNAADTYMRLALRAQNQCRTTLETLATIKNPPVIFAKQANIAHGHQQVNNSIPALTTHAGGNQNQQNELLEAQHGGKTLDSRTTSIAGGKDKAMEAVD